MCVEMNYKDASLPIEERVRDLLGRMTLEEKIGQLVQPFGWKAYRKEKDGSVALAESFKEDVAKGGIGSLYGVLRADPWTEVTLETGLSPKEGAAATNEIQRFAIENSRLGIPILFGEECSHGHMAIGATVFPVPLAVGSTWNPELYRDMCRAIVVETRSQGGAATRSEMGKDGGLRRGPVSHRGNGGCGGTGAAGGPTGRNGRHYRYA